MKATPFDGPVARHYQFARSTAMLLALAVSAAAAPLAYVPISQPAGVQLIDIATNAIITTIPLTCNPSQLAISHDGKFVYVAESGTASAGFGNTVKVIETASHAVAGSISVGQQPEDITIAPNGQFVYVANAGANSVSVIATETNAVVATIIVGKGPTGLAISPDGAFLYVADMLAGAVSVIDTGSNAVISTIAVGTGSGNLAISPDGAFLYTADFVSGGVSVIDTSSRTVVSTIKTAGNTYGIAASPDGRYVYVVSGTDTQGFYVSSIDALTATITANIPLNASAPSGQLAVSPDGAYVFVTNAGSNIIVVATATNTVIDPIPAAATSGRLEFASEAGQETVLSSLILRQPRITAGTAATATAVLTTAAPAGGAVIALASNNAAAAVNTSVPVAAGSRIATVPITTQAVTSPTQVTLTATLNNASKTAAITVTPATGIAISKVAVDPTSLISGSSASGTVTLTAAAPAGGLPVQLWTNGLAVSVPSYLVVPAGATSAAFPVTTTSTAATLYETITAYYDGVSRTTSLTVNPVLALSSLSVDTSLVGGTSATGTVTLNAGAPTEGATIDLWTDGTPAFVPANVTIPAGSSTGTFTISTIYTSAPVQRTVTAFYKGILKTAAITVTPVLGIATVSVTPETVVAGTWAVGSLTLTTPAPPGGVVAELWTSGSPAFGPSSIAIPAGSSSATFPVVTVPVFSFSLMQSTITAFYNGSSQTTTLNVTP